MSAANETVHVEPHAPRSEGQSEPESRYFVVVNYKPWKGERSGDPIPWLASIYRGELVEAYWRGTEDEATGALDEYLAQRVSSDD